MRRSLPHVGGDIEKLSRLDVVLRVGTLVLANVGGKSMEREYKSWNPVSVRFLERELDEKRLCLGGLPENEKRPLSLPYEHAIVFRAHVYRCLLGNQPSEIQSLDELNVFDDDGTIVVARCRLGENNGSHRTGLSYSEVRARRRDELDWLERFEKAADETVVFELRHDVDPECFRLWQQERQSVVELEPIAFEHELHLLDTRKKLTRDETDLPGLDVEGHRRAWNAIGFDPPRTFLRARSGALHDGAPGAVILDGNADEADVVDRGPNGEHFHAGGDVWYVVGEEDHQTSRTCEGARKRQTRFYLVNAQIRLPFGSRCRRGLALFAGVECRGRWIRSEHDPLDTLRRALELGEVASKSILRRVAVRGHRRRAVDDENDSERRVFSEPSRLDEKPRRRNDGEELQPQEQGRTEPFDFSTAFALERTRRCFRHELLAEAPSFFPTQAYFVTPFYFSVSAGSPRR